MNGLDNQRDFYIKDKFKQDEQISKKADDVFNNFLKDIKMQNQTNNLENDNPKVVNFDEAKKKKKSSGKKILSIAASLMVIFLAANVYAATQGYNNIFFIIRNLITNQQAITSKDEILSDKDITISYKSIEIAKGIKMQINRLAVANEKATLYLRVDKTEDALDLTPFTYVVTDEDGKELANYESLDESDAYTEELELSNFSNTTNIINLDINDAKGRKVVEFKIDLEKQEIEVLGNEEELKKISEVELKKYLSAFAMLNYEDEFLNTSKVSNKELVENERKLLVANELARMNSIKIYTNESYSGNDNEYVLDTKKANNIVKSFTSLDLASDGLMDLAGVYYFEGEIDGTRRYVYNPNYDGKLTALCLDVKDIMYSQGIYTVTYTYCYPLYDSTGESYEDGIEELPIYEMTISLMLNEDDKYSKYYVSSKLESEIVENGTPITQTKNAIEEYSNTLETYLNLKAATEYSPENVITELGLLTYPQLYQLMSDEDNRLVNLDEFYTYTRTNIKYKEFKNKLLEYCTEDLFEKDFEKYKDYNNYLAIPNGGATGWETEVVSMEIMAESEELIACNVKITETVELVPSVRTLEVLFKNVDDNFVVDQVIDPNVPIEEPEIVSIEDSLIGVWGRTYNVDHEEYKELRIEFTDEGTFIEKDLSQEEPEEIEGIYIVTQRDSWDIVTLRYHDGEEKELLYGLTGEAKENTKLHYSAGQQVFEKIEGGI